MSLSVVERVAGDSAGGPSISLTLRPLLPPGGGVWPDSPLAADLGG
jgi:hypothetical protein